jgi:hypothetical protein
MSLSSNSIIHLTKTKKNLKGILNDGLTPHYCIEKIDVDDYIYEIGVPMISFCDIPLSKIKDHIYKYGNYGIGLTKEWAIKNKLNPVVYIESDSHFSKSINTIFRKCLTNADMSKWGDEEKSIADIIRYVKNYQKDLVRKGRTTKDYRFSDEREWRFVPPFNEKCKMLLVKEELDSSTKKNKENLTIQDLKLKLEPNDIKYIFVKSDEDILDLINIINAVTWSNITEQDIKRLTTRIFTTAQIKSDV